VIFSDLFEKKEVKYTFESTKKYVENIIDKILGNGVDDTGIKITDYKKQMQRRQKLMSISKRCGVGDLGAKEYMKAYIKDIITQSYHVDEENVNSIINLDNPTNVEDKFHIILHKYRKKHRYNALDVIISKYHLDKFKKDVGYEITSFDIDEIFRNKQENFKLSFDDKLDILVQKIYQGYKGLGSIDEIRDQNINGLTIGASGVPEDFLPKLYEMEIKTGQNIIDDYQKSYDSISLYYNGKEILLSFLTLGSYKELERICRIMYKFNNPRAFSKADGYIFNTMADNSRIVVFRPPFAETWTAFVRKFDKKVTMDNCVEGKGSEIVKEILSILPKGKQKITITGPQGSGKTTLLDVLVGEVYPNKTIRVWEDFFESYLRIKYPKRNILTIQTIESIPGDKGLDVLKKSNGQVMVLSEAAEDKVITYIVKASTVTNDFIMWAHHAKSFKDLVDAMRNACLNTGAFTDETAAERQVISVLDFDIHLNVSPTGERFIERITECVAVEEDAAYPELENIIKSNNMNEKVDKLIEIMKLHFEKRTTVKRYKDVNIIEYDLDNKEYVAKNPISRARTEEIMKNLLDTDKIRFRKLLKVIQENIVQDNIA
jgi:pilus assembly protein CpaF